MIQRRFLLFSAFLLQVWNVPTPLQAQTGPCRGGNAPFEMANSVSEDQILWKTDVPCGASDEMSQIVPIGRDLLLVVYADGPPQLIDKRRGTVLWIQDKLVDSGPGGRPGMDATTCIGSVEDLVLMRVDRFGRTRLNAVGLDGNVRWTLSWESKSPPVLLPLAERNILVAVPTGPGMLAGYNLTNGSKAWERNCPDPVQVVADFPSATEPQKLYLFGETIESIDPVTGKILWQRADIKMGEASPNPKIDPGNVYFIDNKNKLHRLSGSTGQSISVIPLDNSIAFSNIVPSNNTTYVRGFKEAKNQAHKYCIISIDHRDKTSTWEYWSEEPSVSNVIERGDSVFIATPYDFIGLDRKTGQKKVQSRASDIGRSFPVRLMEYPDKIVFIGELVVTGFDPNSGKEIYREGFDPISQTEHLDGVEAYLAKLWQDLKGFGSIGKSAFKDQEPNAISSLWKFKLSSAFFDESRKSQEAADSYRKASRDSWAKYRSLGDSFMASKSSNAFTSAQLNDSFSRMETSVGLSFMMLENIQSSITELTKKDRERVRQLLKTKRFLRSLYSFDHDGDFVWRPKKNLDGMNKTIVIHLPSGKRSEVSLTPSLGRHSYLGFQCLVDGQNGLIYAQAMRVAPENEQKDSTKAVAKALGKNEFGRYVVAKSAKLTP